MSVYVAPYGSHVAWGRIQDDYVLVADTLAELHPFAAQMGLRHTHFSPGPMPRYNLTDAGVLEARSRGAREISAVEAIRKMRSLACRPGRTRRRGR